MAVAGTRSELVAGGFGLAFKADAPWVGTAIAGVDGPAGRLQPTDEAVTRFHTGLEGSRAFTLAGLDVPDAERRARAGHDGGDAETGAGGGRSHRPHRRGRGDRTRDRPTGADATPSGRGVLRAGRCRWPKPTPSTPLGFMARLAPLWSGQATSGAEALWGRETLANLAHGGLA